MSTIRHCLVQKGFAVWSIHPQESVFDALKLMAEKDIGALLVMEGASLVGIFSERDYARKVILQGKTSKETRVAEIMTSPVFTVHIEQSVEYCMALMTARHIRHLPVLDQEKVVGVISIGDVVKEIIADQEFTIEQLGNYIAGQR